MDLINQQPYVLVNHVAVRKERKKVKAKVDDAEDEKRLAINSSLSSLISIQ